MKNDDRVQSRKKQLITEAKLILEKIRKLDKQNRYQDPLTAPAIIAEAIGRGDPGCSPSAWCEGWPAARCRTCSCKWSQCCGRPSGRNFNRRAASGHPFNFTF
ncbi:MAG: hypothetical protein U5N58_04615 [Actinomycetota bacterium]|nr:hypothetical protein [Actinomycetota bacterium]